MRLTPEIKKLKIAARQSDLARLQAYRVGDALKGKFPGIEIEYAFRASLGDINLQDPLWKMPEKGVFTEDFLKDLIEGTADIVVHSWKDLPTEPRKSTEIVATLPRADVRDVLLFRRDRMDRARETSVLKILTSSPRRSHNLREFLTQHLPFKVNELSFESVRGNIPTRLKKMLAQDVDGLIVAKAALDRLLAAPEKEFDETREVIRDTLSKSHFMVLPLSVNPTAAAQGALAVEIASGRDDLRELLLEINCEDTFSSVLKERKLLASYGGGCHQKIGVNVLHRGYGEILFLRGLTDAGLVLDTVKLHGGRDLTADLPKSESAIFPREGEEGLFFDRETLPRESWKWAESAKFLWVARESAWPTDFKADPNALVWTAGLRTWKKLAERGVWVSGTSDGLGEIEPTAAEILTGEKSIAWVKLTHEGSEGLDTSSRVCATYRLKPKTQAPDLTGRSHFFWMSGSSFDRAVQLYPEIRDGHHASGPGLTHKHLKRALGERAKVDVYLNLEAWRQALT